MAVHTKKTAELPKQHIPVGLLIFETKHFLAKCALGTDAKQVEAPQEGLPFPAARNEMAMQWLAHGARRNVNFTGTWLLKRLSGDLVPMSRMLGINQMGVNILSNMHWGANHMKQRIMHKGNVFTVDSNIIGSPYYEEVSFIIGETQKAYRDTICAEWTNDTKNEFVMFTRDPLYPVPVVYRYMEGNQMVTKFAFGKSVVYHHWDRMHSQSSIESFDPVITEAIATLSQIGSLLN